MATKLIELEDGILVEVEVPENQAQQISGRFADKVSTTFDKIKPILIKSGKSLSYMNNYKAAIQDYTQAIKKYPELVEAYMDRAVVSCALGNTKGAIRDYQKAANLYEKQGLIEEYNEAIQRLQEIQKNQCPL